MQTLKTTPPPPKWQPQPLDLLEVPKADHLSAQSILVADFINTSLDLRHLTLLHRLCFLKRFTTGFHQMLLRIHFVGWFGSPPYFPR
ncbi:hypothetical protein NC651_003724 [Populus alba x Populus x berolinensis]|nr:hypothetical protein NC651_003724 [Populus alba x Populus x berolinensis]